MYKGFPLLLGAGLLPELMMQQACETIAKACGCELISHNCGESPRNVLASISTAIGLQRLCGDAARPHCNGGSWLEALADWRLPVLLLVPGDADGGIPGSGPAYAALCRELKVPLVGLVQLQGIWDEDRRRKDGLPWLGWIPEPSHVDHDETVDVLSLLLCKCAFSFAAKEATFAQV
ncbi:hypothetical protein [Synechococcus sp. M16CYN]|uniref:hypothetical protein n=1 Tax=Synechococcus sp. M16CYN TaxID=3103139 RepID=UPI003254DEC8